MEMDIPYLIFLIVTMAIAFGSQAYVNSKFNKYSNVQLENPITGAEAARQMLESYGITDVEIRPGGDGQDFYDPRDNSITLSPLSYDATTVNAIAIACHEAGHACQQAQEYTPNTVRDALVPFVNLCSKAWVFVFIAGLLFSMVGLIWVVIILYAGVLLFSLVTLPVEFNASRRAMAYMDSINLPPYERQGAFDVLRAAALTYVAAALASALQLLYLLSRARR